MSANPRPSRTRALTWGERTEAMRRFVAEHPVRNYHAGGPPPGERAARTVPEGGRQPDQRSHDA